MTICTKHTSKRLLLKLLTLGALLSFSHPIYGAASSVAEIKAIWLINLTRFIKWVPESDKKFCTIVVLGDKKVHESLKPYENRIVEGRSIKIRYYERFESQPELRKSSILFLSREASAADQKELLAFTKGHRVFTVSTRPFFIKQGGTMALIARRDTISYELNRAAAREEQIEISADLLGRASRVIDH